MGDRTGLSRLDRTNGYDDGRGYMRAKKTKLAQQNEEIREALQKRHSAMRTELFKGVSINVNGRTQPTADELKRLILLNGGEYHPYYRYQQTKFMIATNLSTARIKNLRPDDRIVKPEWITESVKANCVLPYQDYQLFAEEPRGKNSTTAPVAVLALDSDSSNQGHSRSNSSSTIISNNNNQLKQASLQQMLQANAAKKSDTSLSSSLSSSSTASKSITEQHQQPHRSTDRSTKTTSAVSIATNNKINNNNNNNNSNNKKQPTMNDFIVRGISRPSQKFPTPKVREQQRDVANIIGRTSVDEIINLINEWVGCSEGIIDDDVACVTKYFYDLMTERNYHNKFCEVFDAFRERIMEHNEKCWIDLYNDLARTFKNELSSNAEASQNLCQLIAFIEHDKDASEERHVDDDTIHKPSTSRDGYCEEKTSDEKGSNNDEQMNVKVQTKQVKLQIIEELIDID
uniref:DNA repair protein REV1 n=1 Tax=Aceria tosichella TaxID=561515 RepID=A0A6G1SP88_9ACAR